jgi:hypothetical protein
MSLPSAPAPRKSQSSPDGQRQAILDTGFTLENGRLRHAKRAIRSSRRLAEAADKSTAAHGSHLDSVERRNYL